VVEILPEVLAVDLRKIKCLILNDRTKSFDFNEKKPQSKKKIKIGIMTHERDAAASWSLNDSICTTHDLKFHFDRVVFDCYFCSPSSIALTIILRWEQLRILALYLQYIAVCSGGGGVLFNGHFHPGFRMRSKKNNSSSSGLKKLKLLCLQYNL